VAQVELTREAGGVVCARCTDAVTPCARMRGLLGRSGLPPGEGILLRPAGSVHTAFMRFAIDVVFLDRELRVLAIEADVSPWRTRARRGAKAVLELAAGEAARVRLAVGDRLVVSV
jgi:uncharacterized membrane protein (UPF0127 family)